MLKRVLSGWSFIRIIYLLLGVGVLVQGVLDKQWIGAGLGAYFASMGLFNYGCAAGACYTGIPVEQKDTTGIQRVTFEEIKGR